jgi:hypothetical protein
MRYGGGVLAVLVTMSSISPVAILATMTALPMASAGRRLNGAALLLHQSNDQCAGHHILDLSHLKVSKFGRLVDRFFNPSHPSVVAMKIGLL